MSFRRASGILLHISSLPGANGIGELGKEAYQFADFLNDCGQSLWQVLPLSPTGFGNSPYAGISVFAGNPLLISPDKLLEDALLQYSDIPERPAFQQHNVDYDAVYSFKNEVLRKSFRRFQDQPNHKLKADFSSFVKNNHKWLDTYSLFTAIREENNLAPWYRWDSGTKTRRTETLDACRRRLEHQIRFHKFVQFVFFRQWYQLKKYCNDNGISIIGDMPFYVDLDSDTVWSNPEQFYLDGNYDPIVVSGVPPDYFSSTGQLWGNPIYNWDTIRQTGYLWWIDRFQHMKSMVDIIRIDHFRGFESYWEIPAKESTAATGEWKKGPGLEFFRLLESRLVSPSIIAEDLGMITPDVVALREELGFPGMRVLQFAFDDDSRANPHKPFNYNKNCVVYTGTHDNDTTAGWFTGNNSYTTRSADEMERARQRVLDYTGTDGKQINIDFIRLCLSSVANTVIIPMQDVLGLGSEARMNAPGKARGNWEWRFTFDQLHEDNRQILRNLTGTYGR